MSDRIRLRQRRVRVSEEQREERSLERARQRSRRAKLNNSQIDMERRLQRDRQRMRRLGVIELNTSDSYYLGELCPYCQSLRFANEKLNCCHNGKVSLRPLSDYLDELKQLQAINFRNNIRNYNSAFAFASFGASKGSHATG